MSITRGIDWTTSIGATTDNWVSWKNLGLDQWLSDVLEGIGCFSKDNTKYINGVFYAVITRASAEKLIQIIQERNWNTFVENACEIECEPRNINTLDRIARWMLECLSETNESKNIFVYWSLLD